MWRLILITTFFGLSLAQNATKFPDHIKLNNECGNTVKDEWACCVSPFNASVCLRLKFLREAMGFELLVTVNDVPIIDKELSIRNPPPICAQVPYLKDLLAICLSLYDLDVNWPKKELSGCVKFEARFLTYEFNKYKLGCFDFPLEKKEILKLKNIMLKKAEELKNIPHISVQLVT